MPYTSLIPPLRRALDDVVVRARQLEAQWAAERTQQVVAVQVPTVTVQKKLDEPRQSSASLAAPSGQDLAKASPSSRPGTLPLMPPLSSTPSQVSPSLHAMIQRFKDDRLSVCILFLNMLLYLTPLFSRWHHSLPNVVHVLLPGKQDLFAQQPST